MVRYRLKRFFRFYGSLNTLKTFLFKYFVIYRKEKFEDAITILVISSGRKTYLTKTLETLKNNIRSSRRIYWHIIDDNPASEDTRNYILSLNFDRVLFNKKNFGLGYSLNRIYRTIRTKYIFHCEDDWEMLEPIDLDFLISELENQNSCQLVLNRKQPYKYLPENKEGKFYLTRFYSFNPHILKASIIPELLPFSAANTERTTSDMTFKKNISSYVYDYNKKCYVNHIGEKQEGGIY